MEDSDAGFRDPDAIVLPAWGRVVPSDGVVPWVVADPAGRSVQPIEQFLRDFVAQGNAPGSVRSYAYALCRWWRFLIAVGVEWDKATSAEARDFVLWLMRASKPWGSARTATAKTAGAVNPVTRKRYLDDSYKPRTIRHSNAVLRSFYDYWIELGKGPLINPIPRQRVDGRRAHAHHNPLQPFRAEGRLRYNPPVPKSAPRAIPDERWNDLFAALQSNRDRAILALAISTAARASELLGIRPADIDWGDQLVRVRRKGTGAEQWLPGSSDAFVWLRLYVDEIGTIEPGETVWRTLRRRRKGDGEARRQPLNYDALRAMLRRVNAALGTNWTMHDLRHTCAIRMKNDKRLSLLDVQTILGHAHLTTTQIYLNEDQDAVIRRVREHLNSRSATDHQPPSAPDEYDPADLAVLFGGGAE